MSEASAIGGSAGHAAATPRWKLVLLQVVVLYLLGLRLWFQLAVTPMGDEAYYWMWGQHLSWSYFDHPPLNGWLQAAAALLGWNNFTVRLTTWLSLAGTLWVFWLWSARLAPDDRAGWFWQTSAAYLALPILTILGGVAIHDHLLAFFTVASLFAFHTFADEWENGRPAWRWLYGAAALLGLAVLTKYNGVLLGVGYAVWVLVRPRLWRLLLTPHLWLAALLAVAIQAPVLYWNLTEGLASFRFHLSDRSGLDWGRPLLWQVRLFLVAAAVTASPVVFLAALRMLFMAPKSDTERRAMSLARTVYFSSLLVWSVLAAYIIVYFHWNIVGYVALAPVLAWLLGRYVFLFLHLGFGVFVATVATLTYTVTPLQVGGIGDAGAAANYGWPQVAARVAALQADHPGSFLGATRYTYAAQLGFQLHQSEVAAFNPVRSQNDYWWDAAGHAGQNAIIVADRLFPISDAGRRFAEVEQLDTVTATDATGKPVWTFQIWLGRDFVPTP